MWNKNEEGEIVSSYMRPLFIEVLKQVIIVLQTNYWRFN